ncbi:MAG TPA: bifunctional (p)ppGpp synthetase/guanosine-3',5'-bis(diphosphate) 3'-pyrophosphohydrolase [bacterium]
MARLNEIIDKIYAYNPDADIALVNKAYVFSAKVHQGQVRRSGEPYLSHPLEVASIIADLKMDTQSVSTGLLHDTIEDTWTTLEELENLFGKEVAELVDGVTKVSRLSFTSDMDEQADNFRKMILAMSKDIRVIVIKLADRLHNMRTLNYLPEERQKEIAKETQDIYAPIAHRLGIDWIKSELEDIAFRFLKPEQYLLIARKLAKTKKEREIYLEEARGKLSELLSKNNINAEVYGRVKNIYSIYKKMEKEDLPFEDIYDIVGFRIVVNTVMECYQALGIVHSHWKPIPGRFKDYVAMPKPNMYQSLHTAIIGPRRERMEIQIRTLEMHRISEEGIAAHWTYKEGKKVEAKDIESFAWLRQLLEWQKELDDPSEFLESMKIDLFPDEVYVFTPKGDVKILPKDATPVDFAYSIHTDIGNHCSGAKVNGRIVPLRFQLKSGDTIEIITSQKNAPSKDWLKFVKTSRARTKIRELLKRSEKERSETLGREIFEREVEKFGKHLLKYIKESEMPAIAQQFNYSDINKFYSSIAYGRLKTHNILKKILPKEELIKTAEQEEGFIEKLFKSAIRKSRAGVKVKGIDDVLIRFAKCCLPIPDEPIIGFITRGKGITVHNRDCPRVFEIDPERRVDVEWASSDNALYSIKLKVICFDKPGMLAAITKSISSSNVNIQKADVRTLSNNRAINTFYVEVLNQNQFKNMLKALEKVKGVVSVERVKG